MAALSKYTKNTWNWDWSANGKEGKRLRELYCNPHEKILVQYIANQLGVNRRTIAKVIKDQQLQRAPQFREDTVVRQHAIIDDPDKLEQFKKLWLQSSCTMADLMRIFNTSYNEVRNLGRRLKLPAKSNYLREKPCRISREDRVPKYTLPPLESLKGM